MRIYSPIMVTNDSDIEQTMQSSHYHHQQQHHHKNNAISVRQRQKNASAHPYDNHLLNQSSNYYEGDPMEALAGIIVCVFLMILLIFALSYPASSYYSYGGSSSSSDPAAHPISSKNYHSYYYPLTSFYTHDN